MTLNKTLFFRWLRDLRLWLHEARVIIVGGLVAFVVLAFGFCPAWYGVDSFRIGGWFLQIAGILLALDSLRDLRVYFGHPPLRTALWAWFKRMPRCRRSAIMDMKAGSLNLSGMRAKLDLWATDKPEESLENRVELILRNLEYLREDQQEHSQSLERIKIALHEQETETAKKRELLERDIRADLESLHTGDFLRAFVGIFWLAVGTSMSSLAPELAQLGYCLLS